MEIIHIKNLKALRLKSEEVFVLDILNKSTIEENLFHKDQFLYISDNYCYFYYFKDSNMFLYDYMEIYWNLRYYFNINDINFEITNIFIEKLIEEHLNIIGADVKPWFSNHSESVKQHLNNRKLK